MKSVVITGSGQITLPAEIRRKHGWKTGDRVLVGEDSEGQVVVKQTRPIRELIGIFPLPAGVVTEGDFDDLIEEAFEEGYARRAAEDSGEYDAS
jgi:AbrB family looped-hinge helix DNA binding protein